MKKSCEEKNPILDGGTVGSLRPLQRGTSQVGAVRPLSKSRNDDAKFELVMLRVTHGMKEQIQKKSLSQGLSISEYVRELIARDMI